MDYFSLTDILVEDELIPVQFLVPANGVGVLDPGSEDNNVEIGSKVDLPFWLARDLGIRDAVNLALPSCFNQRVRKEVQADPSCVNLRGRCYYFYELGMKLVPLVADPQLASFLLFTFQGRYREILCKAHSTTIPPKTCYLLAHLEDQIVQAAQQSVEKFRKWKSHGTKLEKAAVLGRKRRYNTVY